MKETRSGCLFLGGTYVLLGVVFLALGADDAASAGSIAASGHRLFSVGAGLLLGWGSALLLAWALPLVGQASRPGGQKH